MSRTIAWLVAAAVAFTSAAVAAADNMQTLRADYHRPASIPFPDDNPYSAVKAKLGELMFRDPDFSASRTISCSTCHKAELGWSDGLPHARGEGQDAMNLRTPTIINVAWLERLGWTGKFPTLESVAFTPITGRLNMNLPEAALIDRLKEKRDYAALFDEAFGDGAINKDRIEKALATYERTIVSSQAPFDRWISGDETAIDDAAKRGFVLFNGKGRCSSCHSGWTFTDGSFHDIGTAQGDDLGRGRLFPTSIKLAYAFKTPSLRDVALRAPYMHTGALATLADVIDLYDKGGVDRPSRSELIKPIGFSATEKADLLVFLNTLTSDSSYAKALASSH